MKKAIHTKSIFKSNLATDIKVAKECGFEAMEIVSSKLISFLGEGYTTDDLNTMLKRQNIKPVCINDIISVERIEENEKKRMFQEAEELSAMAKTIHCPTIQLVPLCAHENKPWKDVVKYTADNIRNIADIGNQYGIQFQLEPVAWSPIHSLSKSLELLQEIGRDNVRMVVDFWHLWAGGETTPEEVAKLDKSMIYNIHFCDGKRQERGTVWDETKLRGYYPGEGDIDLKSWVEAVKATGYEGFWSCELVSSKHWECDVFDVANTLSKKMDEYIL